MSSEVKRYDPINSDGTCGTCVEDPDYGAYVEFADYAALHAEAEALRAQRDKMAQILRDLVPGCKWRFMRPRIDQALQEVDGGN